MLDRPSTTIIAIQYMRCDASVIRAKLTFKEGENIVTISSIQVSPNHYAILILSIQ